MAYFRSGWRFSDPAQYSNLIPGDHGHPATGAIPFFIGGGHRLVGRGTYPVAAATVDVAPTVGRLFDLGGPRDGYDSSSRL